MNVYRTHIIVDQKDSTKIRQLKLDDCSFLLNPEPSDCYWEAKDGKSETHYSRGRGTDFSKPDEIPQNELLIKAESEEKAEDLLSIIHGGMLLAYPEPNLTHRFLNVKEYIESENDWYREEPFVKYLKKFENIAFGCHLASQAILDRKLIYAIEKYKVSLTLASFTPHSAHPKFGQVFDNQNIKHNFHVRAAFAIISAFSVIEELDLEVRSGSKNPRFTDPDNGIWNEKVLSNISKRLKESRINEDLTFDWVYRGTPTRIEEEIKPFFGYDSEWVVYGEDVRDKTLSFPEAIHNASYLRNYFSAHKFNDLTQYISPYDVFNTQSLARQLILRKMTLWEVMLHLNLKNSG